MRILFVGDVVGRSGRTVVTERLPGLVRDWKLDFVVVNGENAAGGFGITEAIYRELIDAGADAITLGNHAWDQKEALVFIERAPRLIRPLNYPAGTPGRGATLCDARNGARVLVVNAMGRIFMDPLDDPFAAVDRELTACPLRQGADVIVVDMHAETTSEKQSMGHFCDGRASLVAGTHTHAPTADLRVLPGGTAFMSDVGMTGDYNSVIGMAKDEPLQRFTRRIPSSRFEAASGPATLCAVAVETDPATGLATRVGAVRLGGCLDQAVPASGRKFPPPSLYFRPTPPYKSFDINSLPRRGRERAQPRRFAAQTGIENGRRVMAGHSQFKNIMHRKGRQDAAKSKLFGKLAREITVSAKLGLPDPTMNPRLRAAIIAARAENMPKDNIERAIKKASGGDAANYEEIRYEGYGPGGVAVIVEVLTDNRNRTAGEVRSTFTKSGGNLAETGAVSFMFDHVGVIEYDAKAASAEAMFEAALEAGADDVVSSDNGHEIYAAQDRFGAVAKALELKFGEPRKASLVWRPQNTVAIDDEQGEKLLKLIENLNDHDDVQNVYANFEISDALVSRMSA